MYISTLSSGQPPGTTSNGYCEYGEDLTMASRPPVVFFWQVATFSCNYSIMSVRRNEWDNISGIPESKDLFVKNLFLGASWTLSTTGTYVARCDIHM